MKTKLFLGALLVLGLALAIWAGPQMSFYTSFGFWPEHHQTTARMLHVNDRVWNLMKESERCQARVGDSYIFNRTSSYPLDQKQIAEMEAERKVAEGQYQNAMKLAMRFGYIPSPDRVTAIPAPSPGPTH